MKELFLVLLKISFQYDTLLASSIHPSICFVGIDEAFLLEQYFVFDTFVFVLVLFPRMAVYKLLNTITFAMENTVSLSRSNLKSPVNTACSAHYVNYFSFAPIALYKGTLFRFLHITTSHSMKDLK